MINLKLHFQSFLTELKLFINVYKKTKKINKKN